MGLSMGIGETSLNKKKCDIIAETLKDPFFDNYQQEGIDCGDIIRLCNSAKTDIVTVVINKHFLKKLTKSHIYFIKEIEEKGRSPLAS